MRSPVLEALYDRFYQGHFSFSGVTSSHWRSVGSHEVRKVAGTGFSLLGRGFGDFKARSALNFLTHMGVRAELQKLAKIYACDDNLLRISQEVSKAHGRLFSFDCLKQVLSLNTLLIDLQSGRYGGSGGQEGRGKLTSLGIKRVCVIGDGYGYLGSLLKAVDPGVEVTSVNLGRGLFFDVYFTLLAFPQARLRLEDVPARAAAEMSDFRFVPAENYRVLGEMPQDLVFNIASMQEMNILVVKSYMDYIRPKQLADNVLFYCCNRREKRLPAGEIVRFSDYGWLESDKIHFDEPCPWYQEFPSGILGRYLPFDGEILHRFVSLAPGTSSRFNEKNYLNKE